MKRLLAPFLAALPGFAAAQTERFTVTATREPRAGFEVPAAIDTVDARAIREGNPQVNLSETLNRVPGIVVQNRQNYAQDLQVSSRGFGGRSTFGVRGVRLIADGIPATMPDGQGQAATFDLSSAERIEVLRGPFAALHGNASGGVVQVFTADGPREPLLEGGFQAGSFGQRRGFVRGGFDAAGTNLMASASRFETDGYREHSAATREQANAKLRFALPRATVTFVANHFDQPRAQDPLGLTRAQFESDPRQADAAATAFDTRKTVKQDHGGVILELEAGRGGKLTARAYAGARQLVQFLGQSGDTPLGSGGVVDLDREYGGLGLRWTQSLAAFGLPVTLIAGYDRDRMSEHRQGFVNRNGVPGALRRDEDDRVRNADIYAMAEWNPDERWALSGGFRDSRVRFVSADRYFTPANPDDSGRVDFSQASPVAGIVFRPDARWRVYANAGRGFETPTFAELAYRPGGATGLNFALRPARSEHLEAGVKARPVAGVQASAAAFRIATRDEIVTNASSGGRTDFRNAGRTRRDGFELLVEARPGAGFEASLAYTWLDARFVDAFTAGGNAIPAGRKLPGVPARVLQADLAWRHAPSGFHAGIELRRASRIFVDDANSDAAPGYTVANVRAGFEQRLGRWVARQSVRLDNVADRRYAGSVIVAEARQRHFEPAPGRAWFASVELGYSF